MPNPRSQYPSESRMAPAPKPWFRLRNIALLFLLFVAGGLFWLAITAVRMANAIPMSEGPTAVDYGAKMAELNRRAADIASVSQSSAQADPQSSFDLVVALVEERARLESTQAGIGESIDATRPVMYYDSVDPDFVDPKLDRDTEIRKVRAVIAQIPTSAMPDLLAKLVRAQRFERPRATGPLFEILLPELGQIRQFARMNGARMFLASRADHPVGSPERTAADSELVNAFEQSLAISRLLTHEPILISRLVAVAVRAKAEGDLRKLLSEQRFSEQTLTALIEAMQRQSASAPMSFAFEGERTFVLDMVQRTHTDNGRGSGTLIPSAFSKFSLSTGMTSTPVTNAKLLNITGVVFPSRKEVETKLNEYFDLAAASVSKTRSSRAPADIVRVNRVPETLDRRHIVLRLMLPAMGKAMQSWDQGQLETAGTRLMLEIERLRARTGKLPSDLASIDPALTVDPFSGKPFGYRLLEHPDDLGREYLLYSTGADGVDNGGEYHLKSQWNALNKPARTLAPGEQGETSLGLDYPINPAPRRAPAPPQPTGDNAAPAAAE